MALDCGSNPKNPYCTCPGKDIYKYKRYDKDGDFYSCCNVLPTPFNIGEDDNVKDYIGSLGTFIDNNDTLYSEVCKDFLLNLNYLDESEIKEQYHELYEILERHRLIEKLTGETPVIDLTQKKITCPSGVPYYLSYDDFINYNHSFTKVCLENMPSQEHKFEYKIYYILDSDGKNCTTSECTTKYSPENPYNIGPEVFSSVVTEKSILKKWWLWISIIVFLIIILIAIYFVVSKNFKNMMNKLSKTKKSKHLINLVDSSL